MDVYRLSGNYYIILIDCYAHHIVFNGYMNPNLLGGSTNLYEDVILLLGLTWEPDFYMSKIEYYRQ